MKRVRRAVQLLILYSKFGEKYALWRTFQLLRRHFLRYSTTAAISLSAAVFKFNWAGERIGDDEIARHFRDLEICHRLKKQIEFNAKLCDEPIPSDPKARLDFLKSDKCWVPFVSLNNLTIWKKQTSHDASRTLCCYKIYGYFDDVKALSFLQAYLDLDTRKTWDQHVLRLEVVESEAETNSDLIYWISKWPKLFSNRDYIYKRRYVVDHGKQVIAVASKAAEHPKFPPTSSNWRVTDYWSYLIVKPYRTFDEKGLEFSLTYYDDPGSNLPGSMLIWATVHGMPTYFDRLHQETLKIERAGGQPVLYQPNAPEEIDPFECYEGESEGEELATDSPWIASEEAKAILRNVPFRLPPPSDPNKPQILPKELTHDELLRSWGEIKIKLLESLRDVAKRYEDFTGPPNSSDGPASEGAPAPAESEPTAESAPKPNTMLSDLFMGTYVVKASELATIFSGNGAADVSASQLLAERNVFVDVIVTLKRLIYKLLWDRLWR